MKSNSSHVGSFHGASNSVQKPASSSKVTASFGAVARRPFNSLQRSAYSSTSVPKSNFRNAAVHHSTQRAFTAVDHSERLEENNAENPTEVFGAMVLDDNISNDTYSTSTSNHHSSLTTTRTENNNVVRLPMDIVMLIFSLNRRITNCSKLLSEILLFWHESGLSIREYDASRQIRLIMDLNGNGFCSLESASNTFISMSNKLFSKSAIEVKWCESVIFTPIFSYILMVRKIVAFVNHSVSEIVNNQEKNTNSLVADVKDGLVRKTLSTLSKSLNESDFKAFTKIWYYASSSSKTPHNSGNNSENVGGGGGFGKPLCNTQIWVSQSDCGSVSTTLRSVYDFCFQGHISVQEFDFWSLGSLTHDRIVASFGDLESLILNNHTSGLNSTDGVNCPRITVVILSSVDAILSPSSLSHLDESQLLSISNYIVKFVTNPSWRSRKIPILFWITIKNSESFIVRDLIRKLKKCCLRNNDSSNSNVQQLQNGGAPRIPRQQSPKNVAAGGSNISDQVVHYTESNMNSTEQMRSKWLFTTLKLMSLSGDFQKKQRVGHSMSIADVNNFTTQNWMKCGWEKLVYLARSEKFDDIVARRIISFKYDAPRLSVSQWIGQFVLHLFDDPSSPLEGGGAVGRKNKSNGSLTSAETRVGDAITMILFNLDSKYEKLSCYKKRRRSPVADNEEEQEYDCSDTKRIYSQKESSNTNDEIHHIETDFFSSVTDESPNMTQNGEELRQPPPFDISKVQRRKEFMKHMHDKLLRYDSRWLSLTLHFGVSSMFNQVRLQTIRLLASNNSRQQQRYSSIHPPPCVSFNFTSSRNSESTSHSSLLSKCRQENGSLKSAMRRYQTDDVMSSLTWMCDYWLCFDAISCHRHMRDIDQESDGCDAQYTFSDMYCFAILENMFNILDFKSAAAVKNGDVSSSASSAIDNNNGNMNNSSDIFHQFRKSFRWIYESQSPPSSSNNSRSNFLDAAYETREQMDERMCSIKLSKIMKNANWFGPKKSGDVAADSSDDDDDQIVRRFSVT